mmetsp:Transcript_18146/g.46060  ORF Transcript_18146/g.46060 Transcript_18146/m.46060 type:complete len:297 (+) Transcript_18146:568-1458(+)
MNTGSRPHVLTLCAGQHEREARIEPQVERALAHGERVRVLGTMRSDAEEGRRSFGQRRGHMTPPVHQLGHEAGVGTAHVAALLHQVAHLRVALLQLPHEVGDHHGGRARDALLTVYVDAVLGRGFEGVRHPLEHRGQDGTNVLGLAVHQEEHLVRELFGKVVVAHYTGAVEHMRDLVLAQERTVACHCVTAQVETLGDLRAERIKVLETRARRVERVAVQTTAGRAIICFAAVVAALARVHLVERQCVQRQLVVAGTDATHARQGQLLDRRHRLAALRGQIFALALLVLVLVLVAP